MKATAEQRAICESPAHVLRVSAFAGTGKTTTLQGYAYERRHSRILYVAFNKGIQVQAARKFGRLAKSMTVHGLAFASYGKDYAQEPGKLIQQDLKPFHIEKVLASSTRMLPKSLRNLYAARVLEALKAFLISGHPAITDDLVHLADTPAERRFFDPARIIMDAEKVWERMQSLKAGSLPMTHDGYLKLFQLSQPELPYDVILVDEYQDTNPVTQALLHRQASRKVYVGDTHQAIYGFRGARNAMALVDADETLFLTGSFRFGAAIADVANALLSGKGETIALQGLGAEGHVGFVWPHQPYAFLARSNAAVFARAVQALEWNEPFALIGNLSSYRFDLMVQTYRLMAHEKVSDPFVRSFESFEDLEAYGHAMRDREIISRCRLVAKHGSRIPTLTRKIQERARSYPDSQARVILGTAHRAKGMEFDQVELANDFMDFRDEEGRWKDLQQLDERGVEEINLQYVAVTRAKRQLKIGDRLRDYLFMRDAQVAKKPMFSNASSVSDNAEILANQDLVLPSSTSENRPRFARSGWLTNS